MDVNLYWQAYKLLPYEKMLARKEVQALLKPKSIIEQKDCLVAKDCASPEKAECTTFFISYEYDGIRKETIQHIREGNERKRQNTRYYVHGIHEYKGKFNPQVVRALLNIYDVGVNAKVLDPFCGSGTSLFECMLQGIESYGVDINPMAVYIARVKTSVYEELERIVCFDMDGFVNRAKEYAGHFIDERTEETDYLHGWFEDEYYRIIESIKHVAISLDSNVLKDVILLLTSNLLRDYSCQEPSDLRIRRRKSPYPAMSLWSRLAQEFVSFKEKLVKMQSENLDCFRKPTIYNESIVAFGKREEYRNFMDFALTSPPYATALPYIDTQRLSLVWLGLARGKDIKRLECSLIGTREIMNRNTRDLLSQALEKNSGNLSKELHDFCLGLLHKLVDRDGFRKRDVPLLLYKYFSEMAQMFESVYSVLKEGAYYCLIVGYNKTKIGGDTLIDTPHFLSVEAERIGFHLKEILSLETYQRYDLHQKNSITSEALIVLQK